MTVMFQVKMIACLSNLRGTALSLLSSCLHTSLLSDAIIEISLL